MDYFVGAKVFICVFFFKLIFTNSYSQDGLVYETSFTIIANVRVLLCGIMNL